MTSSFPSCSRRWDASSPPRLLQSSQTRRTKPPRLPLFLSLFCLNLTKADVCSQKPPLFQSRPFRGPSLALPETLSSSIRRPKAVSHLRASPLEESADQLLAAASNGLNGNGAVPFFFPFLKLPSEVSLPLPSPPSLPSLDFNLDLPDVYLDPQQVAAFIEETGHVVDSYRMPAWWYPTQAVEASNPFIESIFLGSNIAYGAAAVELFRDPTVPRWCPWFILTAGLVSFAFHYVQIHEGIDSGIVHVGLLLDSTIAVAASLATIGYLFLEGRLKPTITTGALSVAALALLWDTTAYTFEHTAWHWLSAFVVWRLFKQI
uniref:Uncharacterized protein n=1 Tax=Chromera velia CCMP2878 TaxID=1169474 RepID=A0A0G4HBV6_9ALVE|mmetsp:Transcript_1587/g.3313  ORF Transcript_1587/g.3313 Transcript_1587/m.3313 type:complete len:318 (-) Transcript_1587:1200-2153(-)|eukprot:Cvel_26055.t1-p1 / transcript=Cvel_26055.t1 / gene=Cvel_26055 / organism=Chromera_velia_CCMP2878 / gene_product=hypothetical protein / transcript_product=hypothetical protein / location=Cvel_scaffold3038:2918-4470(+) / protein_length=317 / sequence_SO=supercontig / SO=protein_coding / is_pseudo=false